MKSNTTWAPCLILFAAVPLLVGCQNTVLGPEGVDSGALGVEDPAPEPGPPILLILPVEPELAVGDFLQLRRIWEDGGVAYDDPSNVIQWESDDPGIAVVTAEGLVLCQKEGNVRITATNDAGTAEVLLRVKAR